MASGFYGDTSQLIILGERCAGKTHLTMLGAVFDAHQGQRVLWQCHNASEYGRHALESVVEIIDRLGLKPTRVSRKEASIEFPACGCIDFRSAVARREIPDDYDVHVLDDCYWEVQPKAPRVIRTVCTSVFYGS